MVCMEPKVDRTMGFVDCDERGDSCVGDEKRG